ncbi:MAG: S-ribosylhomocysteine lyase [Clostridiales bacterium]|jgi:S-ribosylhomocysteine lyase|nr:S-ribosylhomocysteine lyase [Clostridiales bacterium]
MKKIASFTVDHTMLLPGMYISRVDGDITTYDMRVVRPNTPPPLTNSEMHSFEHMFATEIRNGLIGPDVIYFGPMGCQTGFYLLVRNPNEARVNRAVGDALSVIMGHTGAVYGASEKECGNYANLDLSAAKAVAARYMKIFSGIANY